MSGEKAKPFARVSFAAHGYGTLIVGGQIVAGELAADPTLPSVADHINAAVEQREARLAGALRGVVSFLTYLGADDEPSTMVNPEAARRLAAHASAALEGHGDYVPRAELDAANAVIKDLQKLTEALSENTSDAIVPFLRAAGVREKEPPVVPAVTRDAAGVVRLTGFSDSALLNEIRRRGYAEPGVVTQHYVEPACDSAAHPHCNRCGYCEDAGPCICYAR